jgi:hypothetical protein
MSRTSEKLTHLLAQVCGETPDGVEDEHLILLGGHLSGDVGPLLEPIAVLPDNIRSSDRRCHVVCRFLSKLSEVLRDELLVTILWWVGASV